MPRKNAAGLSDPNSNFILQIPSNSNRRPVLPGTQPGDYLGYFANRLGEQLIFLATPLFVPLCSNGSVV